MKALLRPSLWLAVAALAACQSGAPVPKEPITPATHTWFPIVTGPHAVECDTCHGEFASFKQFDCLSCHQDAGGQGHEQSVTDALHLGFAGYSYTSVACLACHPDGTRSGGGSLPTVGTHDPARDVSVDALIPTYLGTSIATLSPLTQSLAMQMNHQATQVPAAAFSACSNCHNPGALFPGDLHSSLANLKLAQPTSCSDCHFTAPTGFVGPTATAPVRSPPSGEMKHDAVLWTNGAPTTSGIVPLECGGCHKSPSQAVSATWATNPAGTSPAVFHPSLGSGPQPSSCVDCHANSRPSAVLTSLNAALPANLQFDHSSSSALADCASCHAGSSPAWTSWTKGVFHLASSAAPTTCLPCHANERPTSTATWASPSYTASPFDYVTNAGITHGDGQDCAGCHAGPGTGAWGGTQNWQSGHFAHGPSSVAATTCLACHKTQRPDLQPGATAPAMAALLNFDHSVDGTGDCFGCHQATVTANTYVNHQNPATGMLPGGDWKAGQKYPGAVLIGSGLQFVTVTQLNLNRSGPNNLVTSISSILATLPNAMLHTSPALPAALNPGSATTPDNTKCWHCHTNTAGTVTAYSNGLFHAALTNFSATPGGAVTPLPQPTGQCTGCHSQMRPAGIVEKAGGDLLAMDHSALFKAAVTIGGVSVSGAGGIECAVCHSSPGNTWADGLFHAKVGAAAPQDCTVCHYPLMADAPKADLTSGVNYAMKHKSTQLTFQNCQTCHAGALAKGATTPATGALWQLGAFHPSLTVQSATCLECHAVSTPAPNASTQSSVTYSLPLGGTATNGAQWMNHGSAAVAGKDCAVCHAGDAKASGSAWSKADKLHGPVPNPTACQACHGLTNGGGATPGTRNNLPAGLTNSTAITSASAGTGVPAGTHDQLTHSDVNASSRDCGVCHTQAGASTAPAILGKEWAQAKFHPAFTSGTALVMNGTTGRCSNCHLNVKPGTSFAAFAHGPLSATAGTQDCSACHSWPGTGTASSANWLGAASKPQYISVGGFTVSQPPATGSSTQSGINNLPHPAGGTCTACHASAGGGKSATGYDHLSTLIASNCNSCHEAGSNLVGTVWNGATSTASGAGDTRPYTLASVYWKRTISSPKHFYPIDCKQCHVVPPGNGAVTTGSAYTTAWKFPHSTSKMTNPSTCVICHPNGIP